MDGISSSSVVYLLVCLCCALPSAALGLYFGLFMWNGVELPVGLDSNADWHKPPQLTSSTLIHNTLLLFIFPLQHTLTLRGPLASLLNLVVPEQYRRSLYSLSAGLALGLTMYLWQPLPQAVWSISNNSPAASFLYVVSLLGFLGVVFSINGLDPLGLDIIGLKKPVMKLIGWQSKEMSLVESGVYGLVRHPAYTALMIGMWTTPTMSVGHLLLASGYTLYIVLAVKYSEEPALVREMGGCYQRYMETTPSFIPNLNHKHSKNRTWSKNS